MLTHATLMRVLKMSAVYGPDHGTCFGVTDPSYLRPAFKKMGSLPKPREGVTKITSRHHQRSKTTFAAVSPSRRQKGRGVNA
jgi:hypothetical protein